MRDSKRCPRCLTTKPIAEFIRPRAGTPSDYCHPCRQAKRRHEYQRAGGSKVVHTQAIRDRYGMTPADYEALLARQAHRCAVCRRPETKRGKAGVVYRLAVDHDHVTGKVRGLLCARCNQIVWALEENHTTLAAIAAYLEDFRASFAGENR